MKKIYLTFAASLMVVGLFAQAPVALKSNLKIEHKAENDLNLEKKASYKIKSFSKSSSRSTTISEWINPINVITGYWGNPEEYGYTNPLFPDSNVMVAYAASTRAAWLHSVTQTFHFGGDYTTWSGGGVFDPAVQPYDPTETIVVDSISIHGYYERIDPSVVDTAIIYVSARGNGNYKRRIYFNNPDSAKYVVDYSTAPVTNSPDNVIGTYKVILDNAFMADTTSFGTSFFNVTPGLTVVGSDGVIGVTIEFKTGKATYSQATDTLRANANYLRIGYALPDGPSTTFPIGSVKDYTIGSFCDQSHTKYGTFSYFPLPTQFVGHHPYQLYDMNVKISQTNNLNVGIKELDNGAKLFQNYPNPTNGNATIKYSLDNQANVAFEMMDVTGKKVISSNEGAKGSGTHSIELNTAELNAGIYFYSIIVNGNKLTKKMTITK